MPGSDSPVIGLDVGGTAIKGALCEAGRVVEIVLRSEDPEDLTLREARLLGSADLIAFEADVPPAVLDRARADAARMAIGAGVIPPAREGLVVLLRHRLNG